MPTNIGMESTSIGLPNISVVFKEAASKAGIRMQSAKVAIAIIKPDSMEENVLVLKSRITSGILLRFSQNEINFINRAFDGCYGRTPSVVYVSVAPDTETALAALSSYDFDWMCGYVSTSTGILDLLGAGGAESTIRDTDEGNDESEGGDDEGEGSETETETITSAAVQAAVVEWITAQREQGKYCKAVVANSDSADAEYIVNFCTDDIKADGNTYSADDYTSRIAGILACMPLSQSCTYFVLPEVDSVTDTDDADTLIGAGKLILINDSEKVRIARGVTSAATEGEQKIKLICAKDKIRRELETSIKDGFVGKMPCTYDNKCILVTVIKNYLDTLTKLGVLSAATVEIDVDAQSTYLAGIGVDIGSMTVQQIKEANTDDNVFIAVSCKLLDAMENFMINITI